MQQMEIKAMVDECQGQTARFMAMVIISLKVMNMTLQAMTDLMVMVDECQGQTAPSLTMDSKNYPTLVMKVWEYIFYSQWDRENKLTKENNEIYIEVIYE